MKLRIGEIVFPIIVVITILWDLKHGFGAIVLQILGALLIGTVLNAIVHPYPYVSADKNFIAVLFWGMLTALCYFFVYRLRRRN